MPRDVKVRDGAYQGDVAYLSRLARAVEMDSTVGKNIKARLTRQINDLIVALVNVTHGKNAST